MNFAFVDDDREMIDFHFLGIGEQTPNRFPNLFA